MTTVTRKNVEDILRGNNIELSSTHTRLCLPIICRICMKMLAGLKFVPIKVQSNFICDGHHRYVASLLTKCKLDRISGYASSATEVVHWTSVSLDDEDWDSPDDIIRFNQQDAVYNNLPIEVIRDLLE